MTSELSLDAVKNRQSLATDSNHRSSVAQLTLPAREAETVT
jgi:hypothetical protein